MSTCIDLQIRFGDRYRVTYEESYAGGRGEYGRRHDPWLRVIVCRHGHVYPYGGDLLGASTNKHGAIAKRLARLSCVRVIQDGEDGINVVFRVGDFDEVAAILKPRRRRKLSAEHRDKLAAAGRRALARYRNSKVDSAGRRRDDRPPPDLEAA